MFRLFFILIIFSGLWLIYFLPIESIFIKGLLFFLMFPILWALRRDILKMYESKKFLKYSIGIFSILLITTTPYIFYINDKVHDILKSIPLENSQKTSDNAFSFMAQLPKLFIIDFILLLFILVLLLQLLNINKKNNKRGGVLDGKDSRNTIN